MLLDNMFDENLYLLCIDVIKAGNEDIFARYVKDEYKKRFLSSQK